MIKNIRRSLTIKIFLITALLLSLTSALTYGFVAWFMPISYTTSLNQQIEERAEKLVQELETYTAEDDYNQLLSEFGDKNNATVLFSLDGDTGQTADEEVVEAEVDTGQTVDEEAVEADLEAQEWPVMIDGMVSSVISVTTSSVETDEMQTTIAESTDQKTYEVTLKDGTTGVLWIYGRISEVNQAVEALHKILPWLVVIVLLIAVVGAFFYARYITRPIVQMSAISKKMAGLDFQWQCEGEGRQDEIGTLARSLNQMADSLSKALSDLKSANRALQQDIERERLLEKRRLEFFRAVSHELKTPVTILKGQLEGMLYKVGAYQDREKYLRRSLAVTGEMEGLVSELLQISRMEGESFGQKRETVDLAELLQKTAVSYQEMWRQKDQKCVLLFPQEGRTLDLDEPLERYNAGECYPVNADPSLMRKVFGNLWSNAVHYSPPGAQIRLMLWKENDRVCFEMENSGVQIPEESIGRLFEAFYRVEKSRNRRSGGSGLGLYLVKMILEPYQASYEIRNTRHGVAFYLAMDSTEIT
ncbi:MAG: HAMP domain-containing sensor histidine kinase [Eubacteriales bacterium]|nr:HAMP domain-containing sensor histidine kinase [Eubacteriales bacterium]